MSGDTDTPTAPAVNHVDDVFFPSDPATAPAPPDACYAASEAPTHHSVVVEYTPKAAEDDNDDGTTCHDHDADAVPPLTLETGHIPALASVEPISRMLTGQSGKSHMSKTAQEYFNEKLDEEKTTNVWDQPLETEGWRNPGWLVVLSTFLVNFCVSGYGFSWGVFQNLYVNDIYKDQGATQSNISWVGTIASSFFVCLGVFLTPLIRRIGFRATMAIGTVLAPLGLILASFANQMWQLYLTQGILFGLGGTFCFASSVTLPSQWFYRNRGLATGTAISGGGVGGVAFSFLAQHLIATVGYRNALRIIGSMIFGILCIAVALARSRWRPPPSPSKGIGAFWDPSMATGNFALLLTYALLVTFSYLCPFFLTPSYTTYLGEDAQMGSKLLSVMCGMNAVCRISLGAMADRLGKFNTMFICTFLAGIFVMLIWQFSETYAAFVAFCVLYGLTGGGWVSLFPVITAEVVGVKNIQRGLSLCYFTTIVGTLTGTPIVGQLQATYGWTAAIQFAGAPTVAAALIMLVLRVKFEKRVFVRV